MRAFLFWLVVGFAVGAFAGGLQLDTSTRLEITNCFTDGGAYYGLSDGGTYFDAGTGNWGTLAAGQYLLRVTDKDVNLCFNANSCQTGGEKFPMGTVVLLSVQRGGETLSCRSSDGTGDVILTHAN